MIQSIVPERKIKDPRQLLFHFPSMPVQVYAQLIAEFHSDQMLKMAEQIAHSLGFNLVPYSCLHWKVRRNIAAERKVKIGRCSYFMLKPSEMPQRSLEKFQEYLEEINAAC
jgi:hypothetical protein